MRVVVTGGAGYIGSIVTERLVASGHPVLVIDDLSKGHRDTVPPEAGGGGSAVATQAAERCAGDPAVLIASSARIARDLCWQPRRQLDDIGTSAWTWMTTPRTSLVPR